jgi:hypothetical protein
MKKERKNKIWKKLDFRNKNKKKENCMNEDRKKI